MLEQNISVDSNQSPAAESSQGTTETPSYVAQLVGEGKKFKSVEALAFGKLKADELIETLLKEKQRLEQALSVQTFEKEILPMTTPQNEQPTNQPVQNIVEPTTKGTLDVDIQKLVMEAMQVANAQKQAEENWNKVNKVLVQEFGDSAEKAMSEKAASLNLSLEDLKTLAVKSPESFFTLVNIKPQNAQHKTSYDASAAFSKGADNAQKNIMDELENLRINNPEKYYSPSFQVELYKRTFSGN